jgi:hypothetical protein
MFTQLFAGSGSLIDVVNLTPLIPLSLKRRGGRFLEEGLRPS